MNDFYDLVRCEINNSSSHFAKTNVNLYIQNWNESNAENVIIQSLNICTRFGSNVNTPLYLKNNDYV